MHLLFSPSFVFNSIPFFFPSYHFHIYLAHHRPFHVSPYSFCSQLFTDAVVGCCLPCFHSCPWAAAAASYWRSFSCPAGATSYVYNFCWFIIIIFCLRLLLGSKSYFYQRSSIHNPPSARFLSFPFHRVPDLSPSVFSRKPTYSSKILIWGNRGDMSQKIPNLVESRRKKKQKKIWNQKKVDELLRLVWWKSLRITVSHCICKQLNMKPKVDCRKFLESEPFVWLCLHRTHLYSWFHVRQKLIVYRISWSYSPGLLYVSIEIYDDVKLILCANTWARKRYLFIFSEIEKVWIDQLFSN